MSASKRGYSLMELLIALTMLTIVIMMCGVLLLGAAKTYSRQEIIRRGAEIAHDDAEIVRSQWFSYKREPQCTTLYVAQGANSSVIRVVSKDLIQSDICSVAVFVIFNEDTLRKFHYELYPLRHIQ